jgi:ArsR family transcriptional regulator
MPQRRDQLLRGLRALADPSRLRLLGVLALGEFTVSELTGILGQSQPRVSRHLKVMSEGGLLERFREMHWVYHRIRSHGPGAEFARTLVDLIDPADPALEADRERAAAVLAARSAAAGRDIQASGSEASDQERELAEVALAELGGQGFDSVLYHGPSPTAVLRVLGPRARRALGVSDSHPEVQLARASLHGRGLAHCELKHGDLNAVSHEAGNFDLVVLERVAGGREPAERVIAGAARLLRRNGRLVLVEDYEALERHTAGRNPLAALREWLARSGLTCERLKPVDVGSVHCVIAVAAPEPAAVAA